MTSKRIVLFVSVFVACISLLRQGIAEEVQVIVDAANLRVGEDIVAEVRRGDRLLVIQRQHPWVYVRSQELQRGGKGWLLCTEVQTWVEPETDEDSPAPPAFGDIHATVNGTHYLIGKPWALVLELSLKNDGFEEVSYDAADIELQVAGQTVKAMPPNAPIELSGSPSIRMIDASGAVRSQSVRDSPRLAAGRLAPGQTVSGWLMFSNQAVLSRFHPSMPVRPSWDLSIPMGAETIHVDLLAEELAAVDLTIRPSNDDPTVSVLEIGSRINVVNLAKTVQVIGALLDQGDGFVLKFKDPVCTVDMHAHFHLRNLGTRIAKANVPVVLVPTPSPAQRDLLSVLGYEGVKVADGEQAGVSMVLATRGGGADSLVKRISSSSPDVRRSAAASMVSHIEHPEVLPALIGAITDESEGVRLAAVRTLGAGLRLQRPEVVEALTCAIADESAAVRLTALRAFGGMPGGWPASYGGRLHPIPLERSPVLEGDLLERILTAAEDKEVTVRSAAVALLYHCRDPRGTQAVLKALDDSEAQVVSSAVWAAAGHPADAVAAALIARLEEKRVPVRDLAGDLALTIAICRTLGQIKATGAKEKLVQLQRHRERSIAAAAIQALQDLGELSATGVALARLETRTLTRVDREILAKTDDADTIARLQERMTSATDKRVANEAACVLAERGDRAALEYLFDVLTHVNDFEPEVPLAVGRTGDPHGILPLQRALGRTHFGSRPRRPYIMVALLMLDAEGIRERVMEEIKKSPDRSETEQLLDAIRYNMGTESVDFIAPLLDEPRKADWAASSLWSIGSPEAIDALRQRLSNPRYAYSRLVVPALTRHVSSVMRSQEIEVQEERIAAVISFLAQLQEVDNTTVRELVAAQFEVLEKLLGPERFQRLRNQSGIETQVGPTN
jgi:HEAT repeat protein